jgi:hypothetical protein
VAAASTDDSWADLPDAIEALRRDLASAWWDGQQQRVRFRVEPVELTLQVGVTRSGEGSAGIKWHVLTLGGSRKHEATTTQTLKLRLQPELFDEQGRRLPAKEQFISDHDDEEPGTGHDEPRHEPE